jgi:L-seryl-tRNA(Ser) seleniumtransferase
MTRPDLHNLPSVPALAARLVERGIAAGGERAMTLARSIQDATRAALLADDSLSLDAELDRQFALIERPLTRSRYRRVLNGTGVIVHTNLGRAPVSDETARAMTEAAGGAVALEIEPESGRRGGRMAEISTLLRRLTGAEAALVINNNAAAILLTLSALVSGRRVAVSRAEAVEIGGGFRIPDVLRQSGATLVEVGTTNCTYAADHRDAGLEPGDAILKVHASNFAITGFVAHPTLAELRAVADATGTLLIEDLGSGTIIDTARFGIDHEPTIAESIAAGVDVATFSGDKLLGGPQAGIVAGKRDLVARIGRHPLARAVRADKTALAGIAATLRHYVRGDAVDRIPVLRMMATDAADLRTRANRFVERLAASSVVVEPVETRNYIGGGSLPGQSLPGVALVIPGGGEIDTLARRLRTEPEMPVYGRIEDGRLLLELRTIAPEDDEVLAASILAVFGNEKER